MPKTAQELAIVLRAVLSKFVQQLDDDILEGKVSADKFTSDFIEGMVSVVETSEVLSGLSPIPEDILEEMKRQEDGDAL